MRIKLFIVFVIFTFVSCASSTFVSGTDFDLSKADKIIKGKSTKEEVISLFGQPFNKSMINSAEIWTYQYMKSTGRATSIIIATNVTSHVDYKSLTISFDSNGVVQSTMYNVTGNPQIPATKEEK